MREQRQGDRSKKEKVEICLKEDSAVKVNKKHIHFQII